MTMAVRSAREHVEGTRGAELIVALNTDPGAASNVARYGVAAVLFDVVDELTDQLS